MWRGEIGRICAVCRRIVCRRGFIVETVFRVYNRVTGEWLSESDARVSLVRGALLRRVMLTEDEEEE